MVGEDEYELLPHEEIQKLRDELNKLKKNPLGSTAAAKSLQTSVTELTSAINSLTTLLTQTNDDMTKEFNRTSISEHFSQISSQNEQIAQGILTVAQLISQNGSSPSLAVNSQSVQGQQSQFQQQTPPQSQQGQPAMSQSTPQPPQGQAMPDSQAPAFDPNQDPYLASPSQSPPPSSNMDQQSIPVPPPTSSAPMPPLDLPPAPERKKGGIMGMFK